jgi:hypothetical protein
MKPGASECRNEQRFPLSATSACFYALVIRALSIFAPIRSSPMPFLIATHAKQDSPQLIDNIHSRYFLIATLCTPNCNG